MPIEVYSELDMNTNKVLEVGDPTLDDDAANKRYVDGLVGQSDWKQSARAASSANINLTAPGASIDGVALSAGDRFLARGQTLGQENGIYVFQGAAVPAIRAADGDTASELTAGMVVSVEEGSFADMLWLLSTNNPIVVGTTPLTFSYAGGAPFTTLVGDGSSQTITVNHNLGTRFLHVTVYRNSGTFSEVQPEIRHTSNDTITLRFTPAPALNEFQVVIG